MLNIFKYLVKTVYNEGNVMNAGNMIKEGDMMNALVPGAGLMPGGGSFLLHIVGPNFQVFLSYLDKTIIYDILNSKNEANNIAITKIQLRRREMHKI